VISFDLRSERLNRGWSRRAAAKEIGVSSYALKSLEAGGSASPASAKKIADFFEIQVVDLMPVEHRSAA
jgi:transcriptional regulator with XRE-family HTH domain